MKRTLIAVAALVGLASAANAATLSINPGGVGGTYNVGDLITITVTGDSAGASDLGIFGRILFSNGGIANIDAASASQNTLLAFGSIPWTNGTTTCNASDCDMFNALSAFGLSPAPASNLMVSTVSFLAAAPGTTTLTWETDPNTGFQLNFFGITSSAGSSITVVPEPTTAALLGLGLFGLAVAGRRRA